MPAPAQQPQPAPLAHSAISVPILYAAFLVSGFAALVYQVVWQRSLFSIYGVNIESVTIVVSAFMLGLGLGSFAGGKLSARPGVQLLRWFGLIEVTIGLLGAVSLVVFRAVGAFTAGVSGPTVFALTFALLVLPTSLMGSTLPLLVAHAVKVSGNVGKSVGALYFVNTMGSALASFATAAVLLGALGQQRTVWLAATLNIAIGGFVLWRSKGSERSERPAL
jgi:spermidine synthase